eukprot:5443276-Amphidinium_carterae.8
MEVDGVSPGSTFAGEARHLTRDQRLPEYDSGEAPGSTLPGASAESKPTDEFVDCLPEPVSIDSTCIRVFGAETLAAILKQEDVVKGLERDLLAFEEGSEAYQAMQSQIAVMKQMVEHYRLALQQAHAFAPPPSYSFEAGP